MYFGFKTKEEYSGNISNSYRLNYYNQRVYGEYRINQDALQTRQQYPLIRYGHVT